MSIGTDRWDPEPFPGCEEAEKNIRIFMRKAAEFYDGVLVLFVSNPDGPSDRVHYLVQGSGNPHATDSLAEHWLGGKIPQGTWYFGPAGLLPVGAAEPDAEDWDAPLPWSDAVAGALEAWADMFAERIGYSAAGLLVLASAGQGPAGSTKALAKAYGNSMACHGALASWLDGRRSE